MVFKRLRAGLASGVSVDTVLSSPHTTPGGMLAGEVRFTGGKADQQVNGITLALSAKVEIETDDGTRHTWMEFARNQVAGAFALPQGTSHSLPFQFQVPWETPVTAMFDQALRGMEIGLTTELDLKGALDKGDSDPLHVHGTPAQQALLDGLLRLGFQFKAADLEKGRLKGSHLPFYQEIEFKSGPNYSRVKELELTFIASESSMEVLLEVDKKGFLGTGRDVTHRFPVSYADAERIDWASWLDQRLASMGAR